MCLYIVVVCCMYIFIFFFKQKTAYEMRISDWSSDVCSSDLLGYGHMCMIAYELELRHDHLSICSALRLMNSPAIRLFFSAIVYRHAENLPRDRKSVV